MIELQVEEYCKDCSDFEVEQESIKLCGFGFEDNQHFLSCKHQKKCKAIKKYLEREK